MKFAKAIERRKEPAEVTIWAKVIQKPPWKRYTMSVLKYRSVERRKACRRGVTLDIVSGMVTVSYH